MNESRREKREEEASLTLPLVEIPPKRRGKRKADSTPSTTKRHKRPFRGREKCE